MRTIRNLALCILHFALAFAAALSGFAKTFDVDISTGRPAASNEAYYHGETIEFRAVRGKSVVTNIEYSCVYYQTNGMGDVWWRTDGLTFHPTNDVGAASYRFFMEGREIVGSGGVESGGVDSPTPSLTHSPTISRDWHANGLLRLLPSPGFTPNTIELPVSRLDFAAVEVLNPPWTDPDYSPNNAALVDTIKATAPAPGNYAAVSNAAVYAAATNALQDAAISTLSDSISTLNDTKASKSDATLTPIYSQTPTFSEWTFDKYDVGLSGPLEISGGFWAYHFSGDELNSYSDQKFSSEAEALVATELTTTTRYGALITATRTRTDILGYQLGSQSDKPLASEAEAEALRTAVASKQDKLPYPTNAIPYAAISGKPNLATVATSGSYDDLSNKPTIPTVPTDVSAFNNDAGYLTGYTETDPQVSSWAKQPTKPPYTAEEVGAATAEDVYRIVAGTNVILVVTNYNSAVHAPAMKLQHLDPESGQYVTYWDEQRRHGMTLTNAMDYTDAAAAAELSRADAAYAPRAWSGTTSALGAEAPAGVTWISTPETVIAGGYEYEKVITTAGAVWVLTSNGLSTGATTNSYFRVAASDGTELFSIEKTDSYLVGVNATGITKSGNTVTIPVNVVAPSHPYIRATTNLVNAVWTKEDENGFTCPFASVSWSGSSGAYVATVTCSQPQAFFYFEFMQQGTAKIKNSAKTEMTGGIIFNGTTYMPTVSGNELKFIATQL